MHATRVERSGFRGLHLGADPERAQRVEGSGLAIRSVLRTPVLLIMTSHFLESTFLAACPGLRQLMGLAPADVRRGVTGPTTRPCSMPCDDTWSDLLAARRVAEFSRFARTLERLIGEADPVLYDLVREGLLRPLALDVRAGEDRAIAIAPVSRRTHLARLAPDAADTTRGDGSPSPRVRLFWNRRSGAPGPADPRYFQPCFARYASAAACTGSPRA